MTYNSMEEVTMSLSSSVSYNLLRIRLVCSIVLLFIGSGCATAKLFSSTIEMKYESIGFARGIELFGESPELVKDNENPEIRISYLAGQFKDKKEPEIRINYTPGHNMETDSGRQLPTAGCIILTNKSDSLNLLAGLDRFLRKSSQLDIDSGTVVISHSYPLQKHDSQLVRVRVGLTFKPKNEIDFSRFTYQDQPGGEFVLSSNDRSGSSLTGLDQFIYSHKLEEDKAYFLIGGSGLSDLTIVHDCKNEDFVPLLGNRKIPFTVQLVEERAVKHYKNSTAARVLLAIPAFAVDVVTAVLAILAYALIYGDG